MDDSKISNNLAQDHFEKGIRKGLEGNYAEAIKECEAAITLGLPQDDEMKARYWLGEAYLYLLDRVIDIYQMVTKPEFSKSIEEMEKAVLMDSQGGYRYFSRTVNRARLQALDAAYVTQARSIRKKDGINASIAYLQQKLKLFDYLSTNPMLRMLFDLGVGLYSEKGETQHARECFKKILEADVVDPVDETGNEAKVRQNAEYNLRILG